MKYLYFTLFFFPFLSACNVTADEKQMRDAKAIHERILTVDTHCDIDLNNFTETNNYAQDLDAQVTLPKMINGGLDLAWFIVYTGQGKLDSDGYENAYREAMDKFEAIHRLTTEFAPNQIQLALNSDDVKRIHKEGKKIAMIGVENGYPIANKIERVKEFYDLGARYMSLAHNGHSQLSDSNTGESDNVWLHNGLSDLGKKVVSEMNKYGMMIDVSHPSKDAMRDIIQLSKAPIIASHSSARSLCNHSRNLDDEQLMWLKENGGVVQTVAFASYINTEKANRFSKKVNGEYIKQAKEMGFEILSRSTLATLSPEEQQEYRKRYQDMKLQAKNKIDSLNKFADPVNVSDFVDHIDYMVDKIGIEHVGISSDFDGGGGIYGWNDASESFNVTYELVKRGYTENEISLLWGGNLLRVLDEAQKVAEDLSKT